MTVVRLITARKELFPLIKLRLRASKVKLGDRLIGTGGEPNRLVMQVTRTPHGVKLSHGSSVETQFAGDPLIWIMRNEPRVIDEELPHTVWRPQTSRRIHQWEGDQ